MELMPGYKHSDVGVIPRIGVCDLSVKLRPSKMERIKPQNIKPVVCLLQRRARYLAATSEIQSSSQSKNINSLLDHSGLKRRHSDDSRLNWSAKLIDWDARASFYVNLALLKIKGASAEYVAQYSNSSTFKGKSSCTRSSTQRQKINLGPISDVKIALPRTEAEQVPSRKL